MKLKPNVLLAKLAFWILRYLMRRDPSYAWVWHCNLAMMAYDAGATHQEANHRAASFMLRIFGVNTTRDQY